MVYGYTVKKDGILYRPGQEVPDKPVKRDEKTSEEVPVEKQAARRGRPARTEA